MREECTHCHAECNAGGQIAGVGLPMVKTSQNRAGKKLADVASFSWRFCLDVTPLLHSSAAVDDLTERVCSEQRGDWSRES